MVIQSTSLFYYTHFYQPSLYGAVSRYNANTGQIASAPVVLLKQWYIFGTKNKRYCSLSIFSKILIS